MAPQRRTFSDGDTMGFGTDDVVDVEKQSPGAGTESQGGRLVGLKLSTSAAADVATERTPAPKSRHLPKSAGKPASEVSVWKQFRRSCDEILLELQKLDDYMEGDVVAEAGLGIVVEVEYLLQELYRCPWGEGECLKRAVLVMMSQIGNAIWTSRHVSFLRDAVRELRVRGVIDNAAVEDVKANVKRHRLDLFRGTVSAPTDVRKKYRIVED